jgi:hypothetical protein
MDEKHVCIGCGRRDTKHRSRICGKCALTHTRNENKQSERDRVGLDGQPIFVTHFDPDEGKPVSKCRGYRNLPGPPPEAEDAE